MKDPEIRMIKRQHDSQGKILPDLGEKRGHQPRWLLGWAEENLMRILDKASKKNLGLDIVLRNYTPTKSFFWQKQVHKEALVDLVVKLKRSTSCVGVTSSVKHARVRKTLTQGCDKFFLKIFLAKLEVVWIGVFLWTEQTTFFL
jgi:hypothetical protein